MRHHLLKVMCVGAVLIGLAAEASASPWVFYGSREMGMGGAGVATGRGASAAYWNPAAHARFEEEGTAVEEALYDAQLTFGFDLDLEGDILKEFDQVFDMVDPANVNGNFNTSTNMGYVDLSDVFSRMNDGSSGLANADFEGLLAFVDQLNDVEKDGTGLVFNSWGGAALRYKGWGFSCNAFFFGALQPEINFSDFGALGFQGFTNAGQGIFDRDGGVTYGSTAAKDAAVTRLANEVTNTFGHTWGTAEQQTLVEYADQAGMDLTDVKNVDALVEIAQATLDSEGASGFDADKAFTASGVRLNGIVILEAGFTVNQWFMEGLVAVGGTLKFMRGRTYNRLFTRDDFSPEGAERLQTELRNEFNDNTKTSSSFSFDAGMRARMTFLGLGFTFGAVARNITSPVFEFADGTEFLRIEPQVRVGGAIDWHALGITLAADVDIIPNKTGLVDGLVSQVFSIGGEFALMSNEAFGLALRIGFLGNVDSEDGFGEDVTMTLGFAARIWKFQIEMAGLVAFKKADIEAQQADPNNGEEPIPQRIGFQLTLSFNYTF